MSEWTSSPKSKIAAVKEVEAACPHLHRENKTTVIFYEWSFIDALYFSMTVTTTIGKSHTLLKNNTFFIVIIHWGYRIFTVLNLYEYML